MRGSGWLVTAGLIGVASVGVGLGLAGGKAGAAGCHTGMVDGVYAMSGSGAVAGVPFATTGAATFDGAGRFSGPHLESTGGTIDRGRMDGSYRITEDCLGTAVFRHRHDRHVGGRWVQYVDEVHVLHLAVSGNGQSVSWLVLGNTTASPDTVADDAAETSLPVPGLVISGTFDRN